MTANRVPVLVGVAQLLQREDDPSAAKAPLYLMIAAVRRAVEDSGAPELLEKASAIRVIQGIWGYKNPARQIAQALGVGRLESGLSVMGGNHVQMVLNQSALDIQEGRHEVVVLAGAECGRTIGRAQKSGLELNWLAGDDGDQGTEPDVVYGDARWTRHEAEMVRGLERPVQYYSMFEIALRHQLGESTGDHLERVSRLWAGFSEVAQNNPNAWIRRPVSAEEIRTASPRNRSISYPYPMLMNANMRVDMGAALVLCSLDMARSFGISEEKLIFPWSGTDASDHYFVSERDNLYSSPAIRIAGARALELGGVEVADLDHVDLYSCFPSAVQVAACELGLSLDRPLTVTGGLTFGGGPLNNYVMHSIARTVELLREKPGRALVTANGGMLTKHSFGVYANEPPEQGFRHQNLQREVDATPKREVVVAYSGPAEIESYAVMFGAVPSRGQGESKKSYTAIYGKTATAAPASATAPSIVYLACRLADGRRTWAVNEQPDVLGAMCREEFCGCSVRVESGGMAWLV